ncbi:MAG: hypothetical protein MHPSP_001295 [Paramarteilia canceri]
MDNTEKVEIISQENLRNFDRNDPLIKRIIDGSDKLRPDEANSKDVKMEDLIVQNCMDKFSELAKCQNTFSNYYKGKGDEFNEILSKEMI